ncbi:hypothetical protein MHJ82_09600 [Corynebacterium afermentans]|uniref:hypothetical protein n=1 Tax=Corynebacterium afermentans TaxID=38286 RepID=UPI0025733FBE|nr:hypothetical protein [Corynebacterium afermentans]MCG7274567.1 hypothetical protein [Corynebacterium afermentans]
MKVLELGPLAGVIGPAVVIVNSCDFRVDLSDVESGSLFFRQVPSPLPKNFPVVVVDPTLDTVQRIVDAIPSKRLVNVQFWISSFGIYDFIDCLREFDDLAIEGTASQQDWFKVGIVHNGGAGRSALDLRMGLSGAAAFASVEPRLIRESEPVETASELTSGAKLLRFATRVLKPIKRYLPTSVVHLLYKVIGVLR